MTRLFAAARSLAEVYRKDGVMIISQYGNYGGSLLMDIIDLPKYQQIEFIPLEHDVWQVNDLEVEQAEIHYKGKVSPIAPARAGALHFSGGMTLVMRGLTDHVGRYALTDSGGSAVPYGPRHNYYWLANSPPATVKPAFVEKPPAISAALSDMDRLKYFNTATAHSESGVVTRAYAQHAKYREAHRVSKTWTWTNGNVKAVIYAHNRTNYLTAESMRNELLDKIDARQGLLLGVDFVETPRTLEGVEYMHTFVGSCRKVLGRGRRPEGD